MKLLEGKENTTKKQEPCFNFRLLLNFVYRYSVNQLLTAQHNCRLILLGGGDLNAWTKKRAFHQSFTPGINRWAQQRSQAAELKGSRFPEPNRGNFPPWEQGLLVPVPPELLPICSRSRCVWRENWRLYLESRIVKKKQNQPKKQWQQNTLKINKQQKKPHNHRLSWQPMLTLVAVSEKAPAQVQERNLGRRYKSIANPTASLSCAIPGGCYPQTGGLGERHWKKGAWWGMWAEI